MRHRNSTNRLGRQSSHRKAVLQNLVKSFLAEERITTTLTLAKESRRLAEKLITLGKSDTLAARRQAFRVLNDRDLVSLLFKEVAPRFSERCGGYTRIVHAGNRRGDNASMAILELTAMKPASEKTAAKASQKAGNVSEAVTAEAVDEKEAGQKGFMKGIRKFMQKQGKGAGE